MELNYYKNAYEDYFQSFINVFENAEINWRLFDLDFTYNWDTHFAILSADDGVHKLDIDLLSGKIWYEDIQAKQITGPVDEEMALMVGYKLLRTLNIDESELLKHRVIYSVTGESEENSEVDYAKVIFFRQLDDVPIVGSEITVDVNSEYQVVGFKKEWRPVLLKSGIGSFIKPISLARKELTDNLSAEFQQKEMDIEIKSEDIVYKDRSTGGLQPLFIPYYRVIYATSFQGGKDFSGEETTFPVIREEFIPLLDEDDLDNF